MAFKNGSTIRPELGIADYSPIARGGAMAAEGQIRGSEAVARGLAALGGGIAQGIARYQQNKAEEKQMLGVIKMAEKMSAGFEPLLEKVDPRVSSALIQARQTISDPQLPTFTRAAAAKTFLDQSHTLLNGGMKFLDIQAQQQAQQEQAAQHQARAAALARARTIDDLAARFAMGQKADAPYSSDILNAAQVKAAQIQKGTQRLVRSTDDAGRPIQTTYALGMQPVTSPIQQPPKMVLSPEDQARAESLKALAKADADSVVGFQEAARDATPRIAQYKRALSLLDKEDLKTGVGMPALNSVKRLYSQLNGDANAIEAIGDFGEVTNLLSTQLLDYFSKTKGAISDYETRRFMEYAANPSKSNEENKRIIQASLQLLERQAKVGEMVTELRGKKTDASEIVQRVNEFISKNPIDLTRPSGQPAGEDVFKRADAILNRTRR